MDQVAAILRPLLQKIDRVHEIGDLLHHVGPVLHEDWAAESCGVHSPLPDRQGSTPSSFPPHSLNRKF
jgi:hypothetical protein